MLVNSVTFFQIVQRSKVKKILLNQMEYQCESIRSFELSYHEIPREIQIVKKKWTWNILENYIALPYGSSDFPKLFSGRNFWLETILMKVLNVQSNCTILLDLIGKKNNTMQKVLSIKLKFKTESNYFSTIFTPKIPEYYYCILWRISDMIYDDSICGSIWSMN